MVDQKGSTVITASGPRMKRSSHATAQPSASTFLYFVLPHLLAVFFSPIPDCDEVFNYWEASHYLNHGYGFQTWEYSPIYGIRSWAYAGLHSLIIAPFKLVSPFFGGKVAEFYFLRAVLGFTCAYCETKLHGAISKNMSPRIALLFMLIMTTSTGVFHASNAYLPSSFAMYTAMLGTASFMDWTGGLKTAKGVMWFGIGAVLGWPFAGALVFPFVAMEGLLAIFGGGVLDFVRRLFDGGFRSLLILAAQTGIDSIFYQKLLSVPWNIVEYNVLGASSKGPNIYGTEPWHYYIRNLILNFGIWFPLAMVAPPLIILQHILGTQPVSHASVLRTLTYASPLYLWFGIFTAQPHKEERFMYPAYPFIALNASLSFHISLQALGHVSKRKIVPKFPAAIRLTIISLFVLAATSFSFLRTASLATGYTAPLHVYAPLAQLAQSGDTVCIGKEWYRFPSSYFLPDGVHAKFIKSAFTGLLPGEYSQDNTGLGLFPGTWLIPSGMNDENKEDAGKYTDISQCTFLVDSDFPSSAPSKLEPNYALDDRTWERVTCTSFLDAQGTGILGRLFWLPGHPLTPNKFRRQWADYCLLRRRL